jgi:catechol 2,3-dioxygenase-like lactoylglutathione lyase family enzyme
MPTLDHVGIAAHDLDRLAATYTGLGFTLTPLARHSGRLTPDGPVQKFGTGNRCAMLSGGGYLELIARIDPQAPANSLDRFLARHEGIHIAAFGIADEQAELARLRGAGFNIPGVAYLERPVDQGDPAKGIARFARLPLPNDASPEGRMQLIRHLTPELLWRPEWTSHPNRVETLAGLMFWVEDPEATAARLARLTGRPAEWMFGVGRILLDDAAIMIAAEDRICYSLPGVEAPSLPFIAGVLLRTGDDGMAIRRIAAAHGEETQLGFMIPPAHAGGCALVFQ